MSIQSTIVNANYANINWDTIQAKTFRKKLVAGTIDTNSIFTPYDLTSQKAENELSEVDLWLLKKQVYFDVTLKYIWINDPNDNTKQICVTNFKWGLKYFCADAPADEQYTNYPCSDDPDLTGANASRVTFYENNVSRSGFLYIFSNNTSNGFFTSTANNELYIPMATSNQTIRTSGNHYIAFSSTDDWADPLGIYFKYIKTTNDRNNPDNDPLVNITYKINIPRFTLTRPSKYDNNIVFNKEGLEDFIGQIHDYPKTFLDVSGNGTNAYTTKDSIPYGSIPVKMADDKWYAAQIRGLAQTYKTVDNNDRVYGIGLKTPYIETTVDRSQLVIADYNTAQQKSITAWSAIAGSRQYQFADTADNNDPRSFLSLTYGSAQFDTENPNKLTVLNFGLWGALKTRSTPNANTGKYLVYMNKDGYVFLNGQADTALDLVNTLSVSKGGTGHNTWTKNSILYAKETNELEGITAGTTGTVLAGVTNNVPTFRALTKDDLPTLSASDVGAAAANHTHSPSDLGAAAANHTHTTSLAADTGTATVTLAHNATYKLTAGGKSVIFKTPALPAASDTVAGIMKLGASGGAATYSHTHSWSALPITISANAPSNGNNGDIWLQYKA